MTTILTRRIDHPVGVPSTEHWLRVAKAFTAVTAVDIAKALNAIPRVTCTVEDRYEALEIPHKGTTLDPDLRGRGWVEVQGVWLERVVYQSASVLKRNRLHRVYIVCPDCTREVDAGHFFQHSCCLPNGGRRIKRAK